MTNIDSAYNQAAELAKKQAQKILKIKKNFWRGKKIPSDPQEFFEDFGGLPHPRLKDENGQPVIVTKLAPYQYDTWKYRGNLLVIKSNKIGLTTSFSLEDFHSRLMPWGAGYDVLLGAQTQQMADEHIRDLKKMIRGSTKYCRYLVEKPGQELMRDEKSKSSVIYIRNPYDQKRPSRIIGIGGSESTAYSWKNVNHIHLSDVSLLPRKNQREFFGGLYSRLANTNGTIKIESIPNGMEGEVWNIYNRYELEKKKACGESLTVPKFKVMRITAMEAVRKGLITNEFLEEQRNDLGDVLFEHYYGCSFISSGNQWYKPEWIHVASYGVDWY